ncbi:MAG: sensor histidine kinase [Cyanobacteria bacterium J06559_3]
MVIRSCVIFELPGRLFTVALTLLLSLSTEALFLSFLPELYTQTMPLMTEPDTLDFTETDVRVFLIQDSLGRLLYFGVVLIFVLLLTNALDAERRGRKRLAIAHEQLRQYALRIENQATVEERNRIAREIHDSLGHLLTAQKIQLNNALAFVPEDPVLIKGRTFIEQGKQLGAEALQELRRSLNMLRSDPLATEPLESLLSQLIARFNRDTALPINHQIQISFPVSDQAKRATYRIVEEALTNTYKHSGMDQVMVTVSVQCTNPSGKRPFDLALNSAFETALSLADNEKIAISPSLWIMIADNGQGFEMSQNTSGFGLRGMQERASNVGGHLFIESQQDAGCKVLVWLPLEVL